MAKDEFNLEQLDKMYDEAMKWEPPKAGPQVDRRAILQGLLRNKTGEMPGMIKRKMPATNPIK